LEKFFFAVNFPEFSISSKRSILESFLYLVFPT